MMKLLSFLVKYSWKLVTLAIIAGLLAGLSNVGLIALINKTLNSGRQTSSTLLWSFVGLALILLTTRIFSSVVLTYLSQNATLDLRKRLTRQFLSAPLRHLEEIGPHRVLASLTGDVATITGGLLIIPMLCLQGAMLVGAMAYLAWLSWSVFLAAITVIVIGMVTYQTALRRAVKYLRAAREQQDSLFNHFNSMTEGRQELKLHQRRREAFVSKLIEPTLERLRRYNIIGNAIFTAAGSWGQLLFYCLIGILLFAIPAFQTVDSQILVGYTLTIIYVVIAVEAISGLIPGLSSASVALNKVESLGLSLTEKPGDAATKELSPASSWQSLEMVGVTHSYHREREDSMFTLGPIHFSCRPGELIFLIGGNGSGKTTLAKLLCGLYTPESGQIRMSGEPVGDRNREDYRQHFSVVFTNFHLFESLLGLETSRLDSRARDYLVQLQLDRKVEVKEGVLSTIDLSQGQRKRLALLTAYLEDRPIYIFDEWAADQDPLFKEIFYHQLLPNLKARGKTLFVISHDDKYYHLADRIIKLEDGQIEYDQCNELIERVDIPAFAH
jgi:putative ATP-binding cassette transporter